MLFVERNPEDCLSTPRPKLNVTQSLTGSPSKTLVSKYETSLDSGSLRDEPEDFCCEQIPGSHISRSPSSRDRCYSGWAETESSLQQKVTWEGNERLGTARDDDLICLAMKLCLPRLVLGAMTVHSISRQQHFPECPFKLVFKVDQGHLVWKILMTS